MPVIIYVGLSVIERELTVPVFRELDDVVIMLELAFEQNKSYRNNQQNATAY
jgi:hypothetical protein